MPHPIQEMALDLADERFRDDPYSRYRRWREATPVFFDEGFGTWILTRYDDVKTAFTDPRFTAGHIDMIFGKLEEDGLAASLVEDYVQVLGNMMTFKDPRDHARLRSMTSGALARATERWPEIISRTVEALMDRAVAKGEMDVITDFAEPLPLTVICESFGIEQEDRATYQSWAKEYAHFLGVPRPDLYEKGARRGNAAAVWLRDFFRRLITERMAEPGSDLISFFISAYGEEPVDFDVLTSLCVNFANAGHFTVVDQLANAVFQLLSHPDQLAALRAKPELLKSAVEEAMRFDPNPQFTLRLAQEDVEIGGKKIPQGETVAVSLAAANRDPNAFSDPEVFDISARRAPHLTFGFGGNYCVGSEVARQELACALEGLIGRFPEARLAAEKPPVRRWDCLMFRGFRTLPVTLEAPVRPVSVAAA